MAATESDDEASAIESEVCQFSISYELCFAHFVICLEFSPSVDPSMAFICFCSLYAPRRPFHRPGCWAKWDPPSQLNHRGAHTTLFNSI
jgi:hypothetical protein